MCSPHIPPITELDAVHFPAEKYSLATNFQKGDHNNGLGLLHTRDAFRNDENHVWVPTIW